ncbi:MAG: nucleotidyltransferase domain-containing protein [Candidatus Adiutrix sp.]
MNKLGLNPKLLNDMMLIFKANLPISKVIVFGSRAMGNFKANSDIDLAIVTKAETVLFCENLAYKLNELSTLCSFDLVDYLTIKNKELKQHIDKVGIVIFERGPMGETDNRP